MNKVYISLEEIKKLTDIELLKNIEINGSNALIRFAALSRILTLKGM